MLPKGPMLKRVPKGPRLAKGTSRIFVTFSCFWEGPGRFGDSQEMPPMAQTQKWTYILKFSSLPVCAETHPRGAGGGVFRVIRAGGGGGWGMRGGDS